SCVHGGRGTLLPQQGANDPRLQLHRRAEESAKPLAVDVDRERLLAHDLPLHLFELVAPEPEERPHARIVPAPAAPAGGAGREASRADRSRGRGLDALALEPDPLAARDQDLGEDELLAIFLVGEEATPPACRTSGTRARPRPPGSTGKLENGG